MASDAAAHVSSVSAVGGVQDAASGFTFANSTCDSRKAVQDCRDGRRATQDVREWRESRQEQASGVTGDGNPMRSWESFTPFAAASALLVSSVVDAVMGT